MASPKTIVISVPSSTNNGARNGVYMHPISRSPAISMKRPLALQPTEYIKIVKEEMIDGHSDIYENESKPPRKRQKLDHLNDDQKLMRRKMKNRVAAQSARDRKKVRMDDLEGQVACLTQRVSELVSITEVLTQHNAKLESEASIVRKKISQCTCGNPTTKSNITPVSINIKNNKICSTRFVPSNVENRIVATIKAPVSSATERSAEGGCASGSSSGLVCGSTLLTTREGTTVGAKYKRIVKLDSNRAAVARGERKDVNVKSTPIRFTVRNVGQLGRASPAPVEEQSRVRPVEEDAKGLTKEEEDMVTTLTQLLEESIAQKSKKEETSEFDEIFGETSNCFSDSFSLEQNNNTSSVATPTTPDIMQDMLNFENQSPISCESDNSIVTKQDILDFLQAPDSEIKSSSPAIGSYDAVLSDKFDSDPEAMLTDCDVKFNDFPQIQTDCLPSCSPVPSSYGSDSGYDSAYSPHSISNESSFEIDDFINELFPSLF